MPCAIHPALKFDDDPPPRQLWAKALSVKQPFAYLLATGKKRIETRNWKTKHRGKVLIFSSASIHSGHIWVPRKFANDSELNLPAEVVEMFKQADAKIQQQVQAVTMSKNFISYRPENYPLGKIVGVADLVDCRPLIPDDVNDTFCGFYEGAFAWVFENPVLLPTPYRPAKGKLGLFNYDVMRYPALQRWL